MISAQSHLPRLSGNRVIVICVSFVCLIYFSSCSTSKSIHPTDTKPKKEEPSPVITHSEKPVKIDTPVWKEVTVPKSNKADSAIYVHNEHKTPETKNSARPFGSKSQSHIRIAVFLPFGGNSLDSSIINGRSRFVQFYAGMKLALDRYGESPSRPVNVNVYDVSDLADIQRDLKELEKNLPSVVVGPYKSESLKYVAEWAKTNKVTLISPWISSSSITSGNPYYLQMKAGLNAHFKAINDHVRKHFKPSSVFLISRAETESRARYFNLPDSTPFKELFFAEDELAQSQDVLFEPYFKEDGPVVFVLPMLSNKDENYIYQFLRRLSSEKKDRQVIVYGTYRWLDLKSDIIDYVSTLKVRLSMSNFSDSEDASVKSCRLKYFERFGEFPSSDALEAYDLVNFIINELSEKAGSTVQYLQTQFEIEPIYKPNLQDRMIEYFENKYVRIVQIANYKLKVIE